jgi:photosystem II stability/assembly factor-like uncharacterized protein
MAWAMPRRVGAAALLGVAIGALGVQGYSRSRIAPSLAARSRANDTPVLAHVAGGGPYGGRVASLVVARTRPATPYVSVIGGGVYRSTDRGETWQPADRGLPARVGCDLVADPVDGDTLYAACDDGLFKTIDGGGLWRQLDVDNAVAPVISAADPQVLDVGTLHSRDGGRTWAVRPRADGASPRRMPEGGVSDRRSDDAGTVVYGRQGDGLVRSDDGGRTWRPLPLDWSPFGLWTYAVDSGDPQVIYLGTWDGPYVSLDGGQTWRLATRGLTRAAATIAVHEGPRSTVFAAVGADVLESGDGGATWAAVHGDGFPGGAEARSVASDGAGGVRLRAGARSFRLMAGETEWAEEDAAADGAPGAIRPATLPSGVTPTAVVSVGTDPRHLVAGIGGLKALVAGRGSSLWRSLDGGATWTLTRTGTAGPTVQCCALLRDPHAAGTVFAVETGMTIGGGGAELLRSVDAGATWRAVGWFQGGVSLVPTRPATLLAQPYQGAFVRSTDGGATWTPAHIGLPADAAVTHVAFDRRRPATVFAATESRGVYRSDDAGVSWTPAGY